MRTGPENPALIYSAAGPDDPAIAALRETVAGAGLDPVAAGERFGAGLGRALREVVLSTGLTRAVIADLGGLRMIALDDDFP